jgi:sensor histidine kinase YesM
MKLGNVIPVLQHCLLWIFYLLLFRFILGFGDGSWNIFWTSVIAQLPFQILTVYGSLFLVRSTTRGYGKNWKVVIIIIIIIALSIISRLLVLVINGLLLSFQIIFLNGSYLAYVLLTAVLTLGVVSTQLLSDSERLKKERIVLEKQKIEAELNALKNQLNSHFLFNTLNNLFGLSLRKSDKAPEGIMRLSELLSIVLYECKPEFYSLEKEMNLIENFIELEQLRYSDRLKVDMETEIAKPGLVIAPMLLFSFVENSFKHGASKEIRNPWIKLNLETPEGEIRFTLENSKGSIGQVCEQDDNNGLGLSNCKQRLKLLYPDRHSLHIYDEPESFKVYLILKDQNEI